MRGRPGETGDEPEVDLVRLLRSAVSTAVRALGRTYAQASGTSAAKHALTAIADTIHSAQSALIEAAEADPWGPLAAALACLFDASDHLDAGNADAAHASIVTAHVTLARLDGLDAQDRDWDGAPLSWSLRSERSR